MTGSRTSPIPLYIQIADAMRRRIAQGIWSGGALIPSLEQLAQEFQASRVTVRQAVQMLTGEGLLHPQRGKGTRVSGELPQPLPVSVVTSLDQLSASFRATTPELLQIEEGTQRPGLQEGDGNLAESYVYMKRLHVRDNAPYCIISLYLDTQIFHTAPQRFRQQTVIPLLLEQHRDRIHHARQILTLGESDSETSHLLHMPLHAPVAYIRRIFTDAAGVVVYFADVTYRGDALRLEMTLTP
ncbi:GntR family transcriptional regulator [Jejubacter calystegiae]|uniref:GntR family transcriptional regulator n=1 Tax=Jejubacter calystegiae TaxID=2579935 RepID=A0A4P8YIB2_9ENTR|nr:GntR family transcriptional regulator [Jejubacter calystegiae]QCT20485.1 GntR family transcriptional regulator [Jejubacter calystegiae]